MVHESLAKLRLDRRLLDRRGWTSPEELQKEFAALPDVAGKVAPPEGEEGEASGSDGNVEPA